MLTITYGRIEDGFYIASTSAILTLFWRVLYNVGCVHHNAATPIDIHWFTKACGGTRWESGTNKEELTNQKGSLHFFMRLREVGAGGIFLSLLG